MNNENTVTLSLHSYNQTRSENQRLNMFMENVLSNATLSEDLQSLVFDNDSINQALQFCTADKYKKKLSYLKAQHTRLGIR